MKLFTNKECAERIAEIANRYNIQIPNAPSRLELQKRHPGVDYSNDTDYGECIETSYGLKFKAEFNLEQDKWMVVLEEL